MRGLVLTGARARFTINGVKVMYATNVSLREEIQQDAVEVLDQIDVAEHVPTAHRCSMSCQFVRVINNPVKNRDGVVLFPRVEDILRSSELTAAIEDNVTGALLATVQRCRPTSYAKNVGARGIVLTDMEWVCIRILDESELV